MGRYTAQKTWKQAIPHRVQVQGESVGATKERAPHLQVRVCFRGLEFWVLKGEGSRC